MRLTGDPERDNWPSVEDADEAYVCDYCESLPTEAHEPHCPLADGVCEANDIMFCDGCGCSYVTNCQCDVED